MKKAMIMAGVLVCGALVSQANLLVNPNFDLDTNGVQQVDTEVLYHWGLVQAWEGSGGTGRGANKDDQLGEAHPTADMAGWIGTWGNPWGHFIRQDSGLLAQPNTQYEFTVDLNQSSIWRAELNFKTVTDGNIWGATGTVSTGNFAIPGNAWTEFSFILDTAVNPEFVGHSLGVEVRLKDSDGGFLQATNASLEVIPEPATIGLMVISGGVLLIRRRLRG